MTEKNKQRRNFLRTAGVACLPASAMSSPLAAESPQQRPVAVGSSLEKKFNSDGQANRWPGCTLICHVPPSSVAFEALSKARDSMRTHPALRRKLSWLPERSYHMTICDLLNESRRSTAWPRDLSRDVPMDVACAYAARVLKDFDLGSNAPFRMKLDRQLIGSVFRAPGKLRTAVPWIPVDEQEAQRIYGLRQRVYDALGIAVSGANSYSFHTTFAYDIDALLPDELAAYEDRFVRAMRSIDIALPVLELGAPEFCLFDSMYFFERQFYLRTRAATISQ